MNKTKEIYTKQLNWFFFLISRWMLIKLVLQKTYFYKFSLFSLFELVNFLVFITIVSSRINSWIYFKKQGWKHAKIGLVSCVWILNQSRQRLNTSYFQIISKPYSSLIDSKYYQISILIDRAMRSRSKEIELGVWPESLKCHLRVKWREPN